MELGRVIPGVPITEADIGRRTDCERLCKTTPAAWLEMGKRDDDHMYGRADSLSLPKKFDDASTLDPSSPSSADESSIGLTLSADSACQLDANLQPSHPSMSSEESSGLAQASQVGTEFRDVAPDPLPLSLQAFLDFLSEHGADSDKDDESGDDRIGKMAILEDDVSPRELPSDSAPTLADECEYSKEELDAAVKEAKRALNRRRVLETKHGQVCFGLLLAQMNPLSTNSKQPPPAISLSQSLSEPRCPSLRPPVCKEKPGQEMVAPLLPSATMRRLEPPGLEKSTTTLTRLSIAAAASVPVPFLAPWPGFSPNALQDHSVRSALVPPSVALSHQMASLPKTPCPLLPPPSLPVTKVSPPSFSPGERKEVHESEKQRKLAINHGRVLVDLLTKSKFCLCSLLQMHSHDADDSLPSQNKSEDTEDVAKDLAKPQHKDPVSEHLKALIGVRSSQSSSSNSSEPAPQGKVPSSSSSALAAHAKSGQLSRPPPKAPPSSFRPPPPPFPPPPPSVAVSSDPHLATTLALERIASLPSPVVAPQRLQSPSCAMSGSLHGHFEAIAPLISGPLTFSRCRM